MFPINILIQQNALFWPTLQICRIHHSYELKVNICNATQNTTIHIQKAPYHETIPKVRYILNKVSKMMQPHASDSVTEDWTSIHAGGCLRLLIEVNL